MLQRSWWRRGAVGVDDVGGVVEVAAAVVAAQCVEIVVVGARG